MSTGETDQAAIYLQTVNKLIDAWKQGSVDGVLELLSDDVEYHYAVGERPLHGRDWVRRFLEKFGAGMTDVRWRIVNHAANGDKLLVEGVDDFINAQGHRVQTPYMGIFQFRDGKICRWRDYVDLGMTHAANEGKELPEWVQALNNAA